MQNSKRKMDLPKSILSLIFIICITIASFLVIRPFILVFSWSSMIVIVTWPMMLKIQKLCGGRRSISVVIIMIILLLLFIVPVFFLINSLIATSIPLVHWFGSNIVDFPELIWLQDIPVFGKKIFIHYQELLDGDSNELLHEVKPYMVRTTQFFIVQAKNFALLIFHLLLMLLFSVLLYWNGEKVTNSIRDVAYRLSKKNGHAIVMLSVQAVRAVALGVLVTALIQSALSGIGLLIAGVPYWPLVMMLTIFSCLLQLGPLPVLIPSVLWLYWNNYSTWGTSLLVWSCLLCILDNIIRPLLIRMGADVPILLILFGVIGGLISFGMIGLFIGPVVLIIFYRLLISWMYGTPIPCFPDKSTDLKSIEKK
ncbi:AI-2E family transporter YdiK [Buchnera aphidicola]|uniref:AI-2E family transporter YdiK n=1 Tax=Buchnera aphidicola TaxID=9 RepID=UPI003463EF69